MAPTETAFVPSSQPAKVYPVRVNPVPAATTKVSAGARSNSVGTVPVPLFSKYVTETLSFRTQRAVRRTFTFPIATESPAKKLVVPSVQPLNVYPALLIPELLAKVNA